MKDEFFRGQCWDSFDAFKSDLTAYIAYWNTKRPQERLDGYAPSEYRQRYVKKRNKSVLSGLRAMSRVKG